MTKIYLTLLFIGLLLFTANTRGQIETVEFGKGAKLVSKSFEEKNPKRNVEISAEYPEILGLNSRAAIQFNAIAKSMALKEIAEFKASLAELERTQSNLAEERQTGNYLEIGYSVAFANESIVSVSFGTSRYSGGAHPKANSFSLNFDLKNEKKLELADLFLQRSDFVGAISRIAIPDLEKQIESQGDDWIARGAGPKSENFRSWTISKDGLNIDFDQYQVAPYADGPQQVLIPYSSLRDYLRVFDFAPLQYVNLGNPVNTCRNGAFPSDCDEFRIARVRRKTNFYFDEKEICPGSASCKTNRYVIPNDQLIISRVYGNYACTWFQPNNGSETVAWILLDDIEFVKSPEAYPALSWIGEWNFYDNSIVIKNGKESGSLGISGNAFWKGLGDNIHIGEIDFKGAPVKNTLILGEDGEYNCRVKMQRIDKFLIVSDNRNCGGANVSFNGIYRR